MTHEISHVLDDLLLDVASFIELSDNDREIADRRYRLLKPHLERPSSPLREMLLSQPALIYPQGSMAIGATIVSGTEDDRFDVDALVDARTPTHWSDAEVLDYLEEALQGFPGVRHIVRCTRCVQMQFAYMHMDVTMLDPAKEPRADRVGEIFHSPDRGPAYRVPSNPYGFSNWYRSAVVHDDQAFEQEVSKRRRHFGLDARIAAEVVAKVDQEKLPSVLPPRLDAQQVVALKLMKRYLNLAYCESELKRPPSIYLTKTSHDCGYSPFGLTTQLAIFAQYVRGAMAEAIRRNDGPHETNPAYTRDEINDRWPKTQQDRRALMGAMEDLLNHIEAARRAPISEIRKILAEIFGERVSGRAYESLASRAPSHIRRGTGTIITSPATLRSALTPIPEHRFHTGKWR